MAGFSYKTTWLAVRNRTPAEVADALGLHDREALDWATGTDRAYRYGVFVAEPVPGWTLTHGRRHLPAGFDASQPQFADWLADLSGQLGEVQFFANDRIGDYYAWARAQNGKVQRAYCLADGEIPLFLGDPTADEIDLAVATRGTHGPDFDQWSDTDWTAWFATHPTEGDVMALAARWSLNPDTIDDASVTTDGIYGLPPSVETPPPPSDH